jgi:hypothetical protein
VKIAVTVSLTGVIGVNAVLHQLTVSHGPLAVKILRIDMNVAKRWLDAAPPSFLIQQLVSTVEAMRAGLLAVKLPAVVLAAATVDTFPEGVF